MGRKTATIVSGIPALPRRVTRRTESSLISYDLRVSTVSCRPLHATAVSPKERQYPRTTGKGCAGSLPALGAGRPVVPVIRIGRVAIETFSFRSW